MVLLERLDAPRSSARRATFSSSSAAATCRPAVRAEVVLEARRPWRRCTASSCGRVRCGRGLHYYGHREKLRAVGREDDIEQLNRTALAIAAEVARESDALLAGTSRTRTSSSPTIQRRTSVPRRCSRAGRMAAQAGVDFVIAETFPFCEEALLAVRESLRGLAASRRSRSSRTGDFDGVRVAEACRRLADAGADVVGLN